LSAKMFLTNMVASLVPAAEGQSAILTMGNHPPRVRVPSRDSAVRKDAIPGERRRYLARNPFCRRMCCDIDPDRVSTLQPNDEPGHTASRSQWSEQRADPSQQCPARGSAEKVPSLTWLSTPLDHVFGDARLRDLKPTFSSSPWMRGAPHSGFSMIICRISARNPMSICGRPRNERDFQRHYRRKPARCQRTRVSGRTTVMTFRTDGNHRYSWMKTKRSLFVSRTRLCTMRRNTTTWCRSAAFSAPSWVFDLNGEAKMAKAKHSSAIIVRRR
jgi:hypothetical protein